MRKKLVMMLALLGLSFSNSNTYAADTVFPDVNPVAHSWAIEPLTFMSQKGVIRGDEHGRFNPDAPVTKAEFVVMVYKLFDQYRPNISNGSTNRIVDAPQNYWGHKYISEMVTSAWSGIYFTDKGVCFDPERQLTRIGMAKLLSNIYTPKEPTDQEIYDAVSKMKDIPVKVFTNPDEIESYQNDGRYGYLEGIDTTNTLYPLLFVKDSEGMHTNFDDYTFVTGSTLTSLQLDGLMTTYNGEFEAYDPLTRAEAVTILYRLYKHLENNGEIKAYSSK